MIHKSLKVFTMEGSADNVDFHRLRPQFELHLIGDMREAGYIPVIGLGSFWSTRYSEKDELFHFTLSVHGLRVGRRKACEIEGITVEGKMILRSTPPSKSKPSSTNVP